MGLVLEPVVVTAEWCEISDVCGSAFRPREGVVDVALCGGHSAVRENACQVAGFDASLLVGRWPPAGGAVPERVLGIGVGDSDPPLTGGVGRLAGDVGDDRAPSRNLTRIVSQSHQRLEIDLDVRGGSLASCGGLICSGEQVARIWSKAPSVVKEGLFGHSVLGSVAL